MDVTNTANACVMKDALETTAPWDFTPPAILALDPMNTSAWLALATLKSLKMMARAVAKKDIAWLMDPASSLAMITALFLKRLIGSLVWRAMTTCSEWVLCTTVSRSMF